MRPLQEVQDIGQLRPFGMKRISPFIMIMETTTVEDSEDWENLKALKNFQIGIGRLPLWNLVDYGSRQYPRPRCIRERPEHGALELKVFVKKTQRQEISVME